MMDQKQSNSEWIKSALLHSFFKGMEHGVALSFISLCEFASYKANQVILQGDQPRKGIVLLVEGIAEVYVKDGRHERDEVLEVIQTGEVIGLSSLSDFLGDCEEQPEAMVEVKAVEPTLTLHVPFTVLKKRWDDVTLHDYLLAQTASRMKGVYRSLAEQVKLSKSFDEGETLLLRVQDMMSSTLVTCTPSSTIQEVAALMLNHHVSSILVVENEALLGIITERDIVERVVVESRSFLEKATSIMTYKLITISRFAYYYDALSLFVLNGIKHLPVMNDEKVIGILSLSDLLRKKNENMMKTISKIEKTDLQNLSLVKEAIYDVLDTLLNEKVPIMKTLDIITQLYDRLVHRIVSLAVDELKKEGKEQPVEFCFYQMGSAGRREQFMLTDQDHFLVYDEGGQDTEEYFKSLGNKIVELMGVAGYARCKGLMMASESKWRGSLSQWESRVREWGIHSTNENLLLAINFFSYRLAYGSEKIHQQFESSISKLLDRSKIFLFKLAQIEHDNQIPQLEQPIRALFKIEKKSIDLKKEILFPYHHGLQILSLVHGIISGTPIERMEALYKKGVFSEGFITDVKLAVHDVLTLYVRQRYHQIKQGETSNIVLELSKLSQREKEELRISLKSLKELQAKLFNYFSM